MAALTAADSGWTGRRRGEGGKGKERGKGGKGSKMKEDRGAVPGVFAIGMGMEPVVRKTKMTKHVGPGKEEGASQGGLRWRRRTAGWWLAS